MKSILTSNWNIGRIFRLLLGVAAIAYAAMRHDSILAWAGSWLIFISLTNTGLCGMGGCQVPTIKNNSKVQRDEEIEFEEVK